MDYRDTPVEAEFRQHLRDWLTTNTPREWQNGNDDEDGRRAQKEWHSALYHAGYIGLSWPKEYGGQGLNPIYEAILSEELALIDAPDLPHNINYLGRAIWTYGTEEQKRHFLPTLLSGEVSWCQGFSEPGAGSDMASLRTRADLRGDHYVVNGQKMWTSGATEADWCLLLARSDPDAPKHKGISCLLTAMDAPGITARPIVLSTGAPDTGEVFFDDVRIPAEQLLGAPGEGWRIAMTTLAYERGPGDVGVVATYRSTLRALEELARDRGLLANEAVREDLARCYIRGEALRLNVLEQLSARSAGGTPGSEGSVAKMLWIDAEQSLQRLAMNLLGADVLTGREPEWLAGYLASRQTSIYGGTAQIQKNILAQRVLGMPH